jgi:glycosyltransferase involved in cell wall biosynthesis
MGDSKNDNFVDLSIIIPVYNGEKSVGRCVESLLEQLGNGIEIIFIDDGSVDGTHLILDRYGDNKNITIVYKEHGGVSRARNSGLNIAKGKYVSFIDSDDFVGRDYIETLMGAIKNEPDIVIFNEWYRIDGTGRTYIDSKRISVRGDCSANVLYTYLINQNLNNVCGKIFRKSIVEKNKIQFDETMLISEDFKFVMDYLEQCKRARVCERISYYYEYNINGTCRNKPQYLDDLTKSYDRVCKFIEKNQLVLDSFEWGRVSVCSRYLRQLCGVLTGLHNTCELTKERMNILKNTRLYHDVTEEKYEQLKYKIMKYLMIKQQWKVLGLIFKMKGSK